jgi:hypothetical protein
MDKFGEGSVSAAHENRLIFFSSVRHLKQVTHRMSAITLALSNIRPSISSLRCWCLKYASFCMFSGRSPFECFIAVLIQVWVFWLVTPCSLFGEYHTSRWTLVSSDPVVLLLFFFTANGFVPGGSVLSKKVKLKDFELSSQRLKRLSLYITVKLARQRCNLKEVTWSRDVYTSLKVSLQERRLIKLWKDRSRMFVTFSDSVGTFEYLRATETNRNYIQNE